MSTLLRALSGPTQHHEELRQCAQCGQWKPVSAFHFRADCARYRRKCRVCVNQQNGKPGMRVKGGN